MSGVTMSIITAKRERHEMSDLTGRGRVTVFHLTHAWPDRRCLAAYTTTGTYGDTAVVGVFSVPELEHPSLLSVAANHHATGLSDWRGSHDHACACWVICTGWSARMSTGSLNLPGAGWSLRVERGVDLLRPMYGHDRLRVGTISVTDPETAEQVAAFAARLPRWHAMQEAAARPLEVAAS